MKNVDLWDCLVVILQKLFTRVIWEDFFSMLQSARENRRTWDAILLFELGFVFFRIRIRTSSFFMKSQQITTGYTSGEIFLIFILFEGSLKLC